MDSMDKEMMQKAKKVFRIIAIITISSILCIVLLKLRGECAAYVACAVIVTFLFLDSWVDSEFRTRIMESDNRIYMVLGWIVLLALVWLFALTYCSS
jgi:hypothetical protein